MWRELVVSFGLGFAIFLFGMKSMEVGLHAWAGPFLSGAIRRFTNTPIRGLIAGTIATIALQSSNAVTVVTIGLVNAGVLTFRRTLGLVLGANIGGSISADMLGLDMSAKALPVLIGSGAVYFATFALPLLLPPASRTINAVLSLRSISLTLCGFSTILIGMERMNKIVPVLQSRGLFVWFVDQSQQSVLWGLLAGAVVTAVIQSSAATVAVTMGLASVQAIPIELGIAIVLGANIGSCSTALLASLGGTKSGRQVAWTNIALNFGGSLLFLPFIDQFASLSGWISESPYEQIAGVQTVFNMICSLIALPLCYIGLNTSRSLPNRLRR